MNYKPQPRRPLTLYADPGPDGVSLHAVDLECRCGTCRGDGWVALPALKCAICDGRGYRLTQNGAALLAFVREWGAS